MASDEVAEQVETNQQLGHDIGAYSTPAFVVNGQPMVGAQPTEVFVDAMDSALANAQ
jgi:protein-disulfide isomerase